MCKLVVDGEQRIVCEDATQDSRFAYSSFVQGDAPVRFYASTPVRAADGTVVGSLCTWDTGPARPRRGARAAAGGPRRAGRDAARVASGRVRAGPRRRARPADRVAEPHDARRPPRPRVRPPDAPRLRGARGDHRPRRLQDRSTTPSATTPATRSCGRGPSGCRARCGPRTPSPDSAATSSRSSPSSARRHGPRAGRLAHRGRPDRTGRSTPARSARSRRASARRWPNPATTSAPRSTAPIRRCTPASAAANASSRRPRARRAPPARRRPSNRCAVRPGAAGADRAAPRRRCAHRCGPAGCRERGLAARRCRCRGRRRRRPPRRPTRPAGAASPPADAGAASPPSTAGAAASRRAAPRPAPARRLFVALQPDHRGGHREHQGERERAVAASPAATRVRA